MSLLKHTKFDTNLHPVYPNDLLGVGTNSPVVSGGKLDLSGATTRYVTYTKTWATALQQKGTVQFKVTPQYSGSPAAIQYFYSQGSADASVNNELVIAQLTDGNLFIRFRDNTGTQIFANSLGVWVPVSGTEYSIELCYDLTLGETRVFVDGVQFGSTVGTAGTRGSIGVIRLGNAPQEQAYTALMKLDDVATYSTPLHGQSYAALEPLTCLVHDVARDLNGVVKSGMVVSFYPSQTVSNPGYGESESEVISTKKVSVTSDANGYFAIALIKSAEFANGPFQYVVEMVDNGSVVNFGSNLVTIPDQPSVELSTLLAMS